MRSVGLLLFVGALLATVPVEARLVRYQVDGKTYSYSTNNHAAARRARQHMDSGMAAVAGQAERKPVDPVAAFFGFRQETGTTPPSDTSVTATEEVRVRSGRSRHSWRRGRARRDALAAATPPGDAPGTVQVPATTSSVTRSGEPVTRVSGDSSPETRHDALRKALEERGAAMRRAMDEEERTRTSAAGRPVTYDVVAPVPAPVATSPSEPTRTPGQASSKSGERLTPH